jgi:hemolysin activation/secretion protein
MARMSRFVFRQGHKGHGCTESLRWALVVSACVASAGSLSAWAQEAELDTLAPPLRFDVSRYAVSGNTLLDAALIEQTLQSHAGSGRNYADVQRALEALEDTYRARGFGTVQVLLPEQELNQGVVKLRVVESVIGKVALKGNQHFSERNVRAAIPQLQEGRAPNLRQLSENVQLANENPARQVDLVLSVAEDDGKVDARIDVREENPQRFVLTLDDTGNQDSGRHRIGVTYQHANLFDADHVLTAAYITSPDEPDDVNNHIYSLGYRIPLYTLGDSIDLIYAYSDSTTPSNITALGSTVGVTGKGEIIGFRYNHIFPRQGEYVSRLVAGLDYKHIDTRCDTGGLISPAGTPGCTPYTIRPLSLTYSGKVERPGAVYDYYVGGVYNAFPTGKDYSYQPGPQRTDKEDFYSAASGYRVRDRFSAVRYGGSFMRPIVNDWVARVAVTGQTTTDNLVSGERLGLAGVNAVRGFRERADGGVDSGIVVNAEIYSPELATHLGVPGNLKGVLFYDYAQGRNNNESADPSDPHIAGVGFGLRYNYSHNVSFRYDFAVVADGLAMGNAPDKVVVEEKGDTRTHFALVVSF